MTADLTTFTVTYDHRADTLYITQPISAENGVLDDAGIIWRYTGGGELIGATIMDFCELWTLNSAELARRLAQAFEVPVAQAQILVAKGLNLRRSH